MKSGSSYQSGSTPSVAHHEDMFVNRQPRRFTDWAWRYVITLGSENSAPCLPVLTEAYPRSISLFQHRFLRVRCHHNRLGRNLRRLFQRLAVHREYAGGASEPEPGHSICAALEHPFLKSHVPTELRSSAGICYGSESHLRLPCRIWQVNTDSYSQCSASPTGSARHLLQAMTIEQASFTRQTAHS